MRRHSLILLLMVVVLAGCTASPSTGKPVLKIVEHEQTVVGHAVSVVGVVENSGSGPARDVFVNVTWQDEDGRLVGAGTMLVTRELKSGDAVTFVVPMVPNLLNKGIPVDYRLSITYKRTI